jgi:hypothetical protein
MASYDYNASVVYNSDGSQFSDEGSGSLSSTATDDGFWNVGDARFGGSSYLYAGSFSQNGHLFLVFNGSRSILYSPTASLSDFPATYTDGSIALDIGQLALCFLPGSMIATEAGEIAVEALSIGDPIRTETGRIVPVKWIGRQTVSTRFGPAERLMPVRFAAGSLGDGLPHTDLTVTADHGMLVDGIICHAGALENGTTITRVPLSEMGETYTVYHIETDAHEIILANGAPAETFIDNVSRRAFDNFAEFDSLYGDEPEMEELPYPRAMSARQVPGWIRSRLVISAAS